MFVAYNHEAHLYVFFAQSMWNVERVYQPTPTTKRIKPLNQTGNCMYQEI
jgi:hypothetical protein